MTPRFLRYPLHCLVPTVDQVTGGKRDTDARNIDEGMRRTLETRDGRIGGLKAIDVVKGRKESW
jgi:hypothetical protein